MLALTLIGAIVAFVIGNLVRVLRILRMPAQLRWELYPIPKGPRERQSYGGSYFENSEWWNQRPDKDGLSPFAFMLKEVVLLRGVWTSFRALWPWSFLLHWGLYIYILATAASFTANSVAATGYRIAGTLGISGVAGLLTVRIISARLRPFTTRAIVFNLILIGAMFISSIAAAPTLPALFTQLVHAPLSIAGTGTAATVHGFVLAFFLAYFPMTHMTHAYMKYFTWHGIRWDDRPSLFAPRSSEDLQRNLARRTSWPAAHIASAGPRTWAEVVADTGASNGDRHA